MDSVSRKTGWRVYLILALIIGAGAYFRLVRLGEPSLRADTIHFWNICRANLSAWEIVTEWDKLPVGQPAFPLAVTKWYIDAFHLPVTHFTIAFPNALFGILAVPVMFFVGRRIGGDALGLVLAALFAVNPFNIQVSREAYFYSSLILGGCLLYLGVITAVQAVRDNEPLRSGFYWSTGLGFFLITQSQFTGWSMAFVSGLAILAILFRAWKKTGRYKRESIGAFVLLGVLGVLVLASPWGLGHMLGKLSADEIAASQKAVAVSESNMATLLKEIPIRFGWGSSLPRVVFTALALVASVVFMIRDRARWHIYGISLVLIVGTFLVYAASRRAISALYEIRYVSGMLPVWLAFLAIGLWNFPGWPVVRRVLPGDRQRWLSGCVVAAGIGLLVGPAELSTRLSGSPTPYKDILRWVDSNLDRGTPVLVDRWFEPWNELKVYDSTNVHFTFTIPNEPVDVFVKYQWRDTARSFFARYPEAAYLEIAKSYWEVAGVGPWDWPRRHFARHVVFTNEAGLKLREMGLAARGDFYAANTNRTVVELFYNTREDVVRNARAAGQKVVALYGPGWGYTKTQDYRDWRVLEQDAVVDLYNLTSEPVTVRVRIRGVAISASKQVRGSNGAQTTFSANQMVEWPVGQVALAPGLTRLSLSDPMWSVARAPLIVDAIQAELASPAAVPSPPPVAAP